MLSALEELPVVIQAVMRAELDTAERGYFLTRLLGIAFDLRVGELSIDGTGLVARAELRLDPPLGRVEGLKADLRLADDGATRESSASGTADGEAIRAELALAKSRDLREQPITARAAITLNDARIELTLRKTLLPSINAWWICGPFDATFEKGLATVFPPESGLDADAAYDGKNGKKVVWQNVQRDVQPGDDLTGEFFVQFDKIFGGRVYDAVAYGFTYLHAPREIDAVLAIGSDDGVAVWLNGAEVHRNQIGRAYSPKQDRVPVKLKAGVNTLLLKVGQGGGDWGFSVFVESPDGRSLPEVAASLAPTPPGD
jgi:hypothetical protein